MTSRNWWDGAWAALNTVKILTASTEFIYFIQQPPEELQRLVNLVMEEPLPADAPPLPEDNQSEDMAGETDGGKGFFF